MNLSESERTFVALAEEALRRVDEYDGDDWWESVRTLLPRLTSVQARFCNPWWPAAAIKTERKVLSKDQEISSPLTVVESVEMREELVITDPASQGRVKQNVPLWTRQAPTSPKEIWRDLDTKAEFRNSLKTWIRSIQSGIVCDVYLRDKRSKKKPSNSQHAESPESNGIQPSSNASESDKTLIAIDAPSIAKPIASGILDWKKQILQNLGLRCRNECGRARLNARSEAEKETIDLAEKYVAWLNNKVGNLHNVLDSLGSETDTQRVSGAYKSIWAICWMARDFFTRDLRDLLITVYDEPQQIGSRSTHSFALLTRELCSQHMGKLSRHAIKPCVNPLLKVPRPEWGRWLHWDDNIESLFRDDVLPELKADCDDLLEALRETNSERPTQKAMDPLSVDNRKQAEEVSDGHSARSISATDPPGGKHQLAPFQGGSLVIYSDRIEFCEVEICRNANPHRQWYRLLVALSEQKNGVFVAYSGAVLGDKLKGKDATQVAGIVRNLRNAISVALRENGIHCQGQDVILSGGPGYRYSEKLSVQFVDCSAEDVARRTNGVSDPKGDPIDDPKEQTDDPINDEYEPKERHDDPKDAEGSSTPDERQAWIVDQLRSGVKLKRNMVVEQFGCSTATAKRDFAALKESGKIKFNGSPKHGHYQLIEPGGGNTGSG